MPPSSTNGGTLWLRRVQFWKMKYRSLLHPTALFIIIISAYALILPYSRAVQASIVIAVSLVLVTSEATRKTTAFGQKYLCYLLLLPVYLVLQFGYNLSIRNTGPDTYIGILQTFGLEAFWFIETYGHISKQITVIVVTCAVFIFVNRDLHKTHNFVRSLHVQHVPLATGLLTTLLASFSLFPSLSVEIRKLNAAISNMQREKEVFDLMAPKFLQPTLMKEEIRKLSLVTIVGESTSKWNVNLYGYPRKTFAPLSDVTNLIVFDDVVAPNTHTVPSLMLALTSEEFNPIARKAQLNPPPGHNISASSRTDIVRIGESVWHQIITTSKKLACGLYRNELRKCEEENVRVKDQARQILLSGYFDPTWYLNKYDDVRKTGMDPAEHYIRYGAREGRDPSPRFSSRDYLQNHPEAAEFGMNPLVHYLRFGMGEGQEIGSSPASSSQRPPTIPIISALNAAGIKTFWYSNQNEYGIWDNPVSHLAKLASETYFHRKTVGLDFRGEYYDGDLVTAAIDRLKTLPEKSALFFHFYATHLPYCGGIPTPHDWKQDVVTKLPHEAIFGSYKMPHEAIFGSYKTNKSFLDCYDSAVYYVAQNIKRVQNWVDSHEYPMLLLYFSDHGDDVFKGVGHDSSKLTHKMVQVPLLIYFNAPARSVYPELFETLKKNRHAPINLENIFDLILDLFSINLQNYSTEEKSIASPNYKSKSRFIVDRGRQGFVSFDSTPPDMNGMPPDIADKYVIQRRQLNSLPAKVRQRLCAHRNDSLLKFMEAMSLFNCLEIDVNINNGAAMVHHDPDKPNGLPLDVVLSLQGANSKRVWLDVKNLNDDNVNILLDELKKHNRSYDNTLIEVGEKLAGSLAVRRLSEAGYQVSYHLPTELGVKCSISEAKDQCSEFARRVERDLQVGFSSLSFDFEASTFVSRLRIPANVSISTWDLKARLNELAKRSEIGRYNMFIVPFASDYGF